jgi:hypothetical protein
LDASDTSSYTPGSYIAAWRNKVVYGSSPAYTSASSDTDYNVDSISYTINGLNSLTFNDDYGSGFAPLQLILPSITYSQTSRTIFYVLYIPTSLSVYIGNYSGPYIAYHSYFGAEVGFRIQLNPDPYNGAISFLSDGGGFDFTTDDSAPIFQKTSILCINASSTNLGIFVDGTSMALSPISAVGFQPGTDTIQTIGNDDINFSAPVPPISMGDVLIFDGALTDTERQQVEGYLANKWGIQSQLPTTHPYYSSSSAILYRPFNRTFQPVDIAGCGLWLDGADKSTMTIASGNITQWNDKSGNGYNATVASGRTAGTYSDANNCVSFPASSTGYVTSYPANPTSETMFVVASITGASLNNNIIIGGQYGARSLGFGYSGINGSSSSCAYLNNEKRWLASIPAGAYTSGNTAIVTGYVSSSSTTSISINGGVFYTDANNPGFVSGTTTYLGVDTTTTYYYFVGLVKEIIFYNSVLTRAQTQIVEQYLAQKWNISSSMPTGHPGKSLRAFSTVFSPKSLGTLNLWLDAADSSTITGVSPVTAWRDKSGNDNDTTVRGIPTLSTQSGNQYMNLTSGWAGFNGSISITGSTVSTFVVIIIPANATNNSRIVSLGTTTDLDYNSTSRVLMYLPVGTPAISTFRNGITLATQANSVSMTPRIVGFIYDNTNGYVYLNGNSSSGASTGAFTISAYGVGINARYTDGEYFSGYVGEVLVYNTGLTQVQRQQVEGYLAWKWGIQSSLPSTHPYLKSSP